MKCEDCRFWKKKDTTYGPASSCRRFAPQIVIISKAGNSNAREAVTMWPLASSDDFCGEFTPLVTADMEAEVDQWANQT